ncbi:uncharacterized protein [Excalfactoria chinensis]|uniref:uncharacterized protein n=1 Tax=Excalfactoria chinensis TaxID=46218 RepID=UPI003B3A7196
MRRIRRQDLATVKAKRERKRAHLGRGAPAPSAAAAGAEGPKRRCRGSQALPLSLLAAERATNLPHATPGFGGREGRMCCFRGTGPEKLSTELYTSDDSTNRCEPGTLLNPIRPGFLKSRIFRGASFQHLKLGAAAPLRRALARGAGSAAGTAAGAALPAQPPPWPRSDPGPGLREVRGDASSWRRPGPFKATANQSFSKLKSRNRRGSNFVVKNYGARNGNERAPKGLRCCPRRRGLWQGSGCAEMV